MKGAIHDAILAVLLAAFTPAASAADALRWERTETSLALRDGQRVVWRFSAGPEAGKPYFHPVTLPDGTVATDHRPADHKWHLGVWFTFNKLNGVNFWGESDDGRIWGPGRVKVEEVAFEPRDDFSATISIALAYCKGEERLLTERRTYQIAPPGERANTITSRHEFTAVGDVVIDRYDYGGTVFRPAPDLMRWRWVVAPPFPGQPLRLPRAIPGAVREDQEPGASAGEMDGDRRAARGRDARGGDFRSSEESPLPDLLGRPGLQRQHLAGRRDATGQGRAARTALSHGLLRPPGPFVVPRRTARPLQPTTLNRKLERKTMTMKDKTPSTAEGRTPSTAASS